MDSSDVENTAHCHNQMGCENGLELIAAQRRIVDLEVLVASLYDKVKVLESQNSALQESLCNLEKHKVIKQSIREEPKTCVSGDIAKDVAKHLVIKQSVQEEPKASCASGKVSTTTVSPSKCADIVREPREVQTMSEIEQIQTADQFVSFASELFLTTTTTTPRKEKGDLSHYSRRHVALKIMYMGARFHGFASEASSHRTVESELFMALEKTKLMIGGKLKAKYTRCGRTDKGVSANGQVVALLLRSSHKDPNPVIVPEEEDRVVAAVTSRSQESQFAKVPDHEEIDYVGVLNRALPLDIRVLGWCCVPLNFHARFSCLSREYNYFFINDGFDIEAMKYSARKFCGEHDFRNFCKMDADNVHNYRREIFSFEVLPCLNRSDGFELWMFQVKGTAFLWHQVRCMVAVLLMIGQKKESPSVVDDLLDTHKTLRKPQYVMAPESALVLQSCEFQGLSFFCLPGSAELLHLHFRNLMSDYLVAAAMLKQLNYHLPNVGSLGHLKDMTCSKSSHVPLLCRATEREFSKCFSRKRFLCADWFCAISCGCTNPTTSRCDCVWVLGVSNVVVPFKIFSR